MALLESIARRLFRDLGLKLAAIFLATALYLHVHREAEAPADLRVPVDWRCARADPGRGELPDSATVRVRATAAELERLRKGPLVLRADLCGAEDGQLVLRPFSGMDLVVPPSVDPPVVVAVEPAAVYARVVGYP
jgi:hypothetical protein